MMMRNSRSRKILLGLAIIFLLAGGFYSLRDVLAGELAETLQPQKESLLHPQFVLLDKDGNSVLESGEALSTLRTCGQCHDTDYITSHSFHSDLGLSELVPAGETASARPWDTSPGLYGKWQPLSYRYLSPDGDLVVDLDDETWVKFFADRLVGGGPALSNGVETNCFLCHLENPDKQAWVEAIRSENEGGDNEAQWAATASLLNTGMVTHNRGADGVNGYTWDASAFTPQGELDTTRITIQDPDTWKATGDHAWMKAMLDPALRAVAYSTSDPYRWSEKYGLLKRGYTIDTWDFQNDEDADISTGPDHYADPMVIKLPHTRFGIMFGDNTGMAAGCAYLAEMLDFAGRKRDADLIRNTGEGIRDRLNDLSWNGKFFTHHVPEDPGIERDLGVDEKSQVSLSNAYSINRQVKADQAEAIIKTYLEIREKMPASSPGEWYTIFPPFGHGYGSHNTRWSYMNGGVTSIVAGELAHGAFEHGFESYGLDILNRLLDLSDRTEGYLHCAYRGAMDPAPQRSFRPLPLHDIANTDTHGNTVEGVAGWTGEGENDLHEFPTGKQLFDDIPFEIIDPAANARKACLGLSGDAPYADEAELEVNETAASIYFLHIANKPYYAGKISLEYADGTSHVDHIGPGRSPAGGTLLLRRTGSKPLPCGWPGGEKIT